MALMRLQRRPSRIAFPSFSAATFPSFDDAATRMNRYIDRLLSEPSSGLSLPEAIGWLPAVDIVESEKEITIAAEVPGVDQKDISVSIEDGAVTIKGEKFDERSEDDGNKPYLVERNYGAFQRSFALPSDVNGDKITAEFTKGVLKVHLPKDAVQAKGRVVEVKGA